MAASQAKRTKQVKKRAKRPAVQLTLDQARKPTGHGGWRPGAGRPRGRTKVGHLTRERFAARHPVHVTLRLVDGIPSLRRDAVLEVVRGALNPPPSTRRAPKAAFAVVEFNVLGNHIHLIVEASGAGALATGMQGLTIRLARRLNKLLGRRGRCFAERYHARPLRSPREVRNALRYVLLNGRHHAAERGERLARFWVDPCSSGPWFDGWREPVRSSAPWLRALMTRPRPTAAARTWLLTTGWRKHGLLAFDEVPGVPPQAAAAGAPPRTRTARA